MKSNQDYKNRALANLEGNWSKAVVATLIFVFVREGISSLLTYVAGDNDVASNGIQGVWEMLCIPLSWGYAIYFLNLIRNEDVAYGRLFDGYNDFRRVFVAGLLVILAFVIGLVLLVVPGIIAGLMFSQTSYILKDDSEIGAIDAMKESARMMEGHKAELFWLLLSFIGWFVLSLLTLGIGLFFLIPYMETTMAHYYEDLKAEQAA